MPHSDHHVPRVHATAWEYPTQSLMTEAGEALTAYLSEGAPGEIFGFSWDGGHFLLVVTEDEEVRHRAENGPSGVGIRCYLPEEVIAVYVAAFLFGTARGRVVEIHTYPATDSGVGRNAPCPCGSGTKFKRCHGNGRGA
jgi:hypothetical protein